MKKTIFFVLTAVLMWGCYDDYVKDYDYSGVYYAYQYNLRSFVVGEGMQFKTGVALGGVMNNTMDRKVMFSIEDYLVNANIREVIGEAYDEEGNELPPFRAIDVMRGESDGGTVSNAYVTAAVKGAGITALSPLPADYYTVSNSNTLVINKGKHTATVTVTATDAFLDDANAVRPYYAMAFRIDSAEADSVLHAKNFTVIAVRCENKFFGDYYHGGVTTVRDKTTGATVSEDTYYTTIPQSDNRIYTLTTAAPYAVTTNRIGNSNGRLRLDFDRALENIVVSADGLAIEPDGDGSMFNGAKLLQERKLFLNYKYDNNDGTMTHVRDTLTFRNRMRDGVNEWQDENPENYK